jgi:hypothetical protein
MRVVEITSSYNRKYGLPEYSSFDIFVSMKGNIESDDEAAGCADILFEECKNIVEERGRELLKEYWSKK